MAWNEKKYSRINWKNRPSTATALGATNLNKMDVFLNDVDNYLITLDAGKLDMETANGLLKTLEIDTENGKIKATTLGGTEHEWDLNIEKIPASFSLQSDGKIIMTTDDGTQYEANIADAIRDYDFQDTDTIGFTKTYDEPGQEGNYNNKGTYTVKANLKPGSVKAEHLDPDWREDVQQFKNDAESAAADSLQYSKDSKRWAVGDESYPESENDNAKKYKEDAEAAKTAAEEARDLAEAAAGMKIMAPGVLGVGKPDDNTVKVAEDGTISVPMATSESAGIVKPDGVSIKLTDDASTLYADCFDADGEIDEENE